MIFAFRPNMENDCIGCKRPPACSNSVKNHICTVVRIRRFKNQSRTEIARIMLGFRSKGRFRFSKAFDSGSITSNVNHFLAVSNKYGLIFLIKEECLNIVDTSVIRNHVVSKENFKQEQTSFAIKSLDLGCAIERVDGNCDGSLISVVLKSTSACFALIYDARCFLSDFRGTASPLCNIRLQIGPLSSIQTPCLSCFEWNPGVANVFAVCGSDGTISTYQVDDVDKVTVEGTLQTSIPKAICLSWSPKGKQLVVGYGDCSLSQFKPNLHIAKKIDPIKAEIVGFQATIVDICWLSTTHFIVLFSDKNDQHHVSLLHITLNKEGPPTFKNFEDVCFGISTKFKPHYYISHVLEWKLIICSSTNSMESSVIGYNSEKKAWELWTMDDEERAELPLDSQGNETFPIGVALDLVATEQDQLPLLLVLSNDGLLCPFQISYKGPHNKEPVCRPSDKNVLLSDVKISHAFAARSSEFFAAIKSSQNSACAVKEPAMASVLPLPAPTVVQQESISGKDEIVPVAAQVVSIEHKRTVAFSQRSPDVLKYDTTAEPEKVGDAKEAKLNVLRGEIYKIISEFENGTQQLKASLSQPLEKKANMEVDLQKICQTIQNSDVNIKTNKEITEHLDIASAELHRQMINENSSLDRCQSSFQKRSSVQEQVLLKERPLTSRQEKFLNDTSNRIENTDQALNNLSEKFSTVLSSILDEKLQKPKPNANDLVYRTLTNMQSIIVVQKEKINELKNSSKFLKKPNSNHPQSNITSSRVSTDQSSKSLYCESKPIIIARDTSLKRFLMTRKRVPVRVTAPTPETLNASKSLEILSALKKMDEEFAKMASTTKTEKITVAEKTSKPGMEKPEFVPVPSKPKKIETSQKPAQIKFPTLPPSIGPALPMPKTQPAAPKVSEVFKAPTPISTYASPSPAQQQKTVAPQIWSSITPILAPSSTTSNLKPTNTTIFNLSSNQNIFKPSATTAFTAKSSTSPPSTTVSSTPSVFGQKVSTDSAKKFDVSDTKKDIKEQPAAAVAVVQKVDRLKTISDQSSTILEGKSVAQVSKIVDNIGQTTQKLTSTEPKAASPVSLITTPQIIDTTNRETPTSDAEGHNSLKTLSTLIDSLIKEDKKQEIITTKEEEKSKASDATIPLVEPAKQTVISLATPPNQSVATSSESKVSAAIIPTTATVTATEPTATSTTVQPTVSISSTVVVSPPQQPTIQKVGSNAKLDDGDMEAENGKQDTTNTVDFSFNICKPSDGGGGGFFGGLGGTPKPESANKNVFGTVTFGQLATPTTSATPSIFGSPFAQAKSSSFGSATATTTTGSAFGSLSPFGKPAGSPFSSSTGGTVAQQGFGNLVSSPVAAVGSSGFGSPATFGGSPVFGSKSIFGSGGNSLSPASGSIFGGGGAKFGSSAVFSGSPPAAAQSTMGVGSTAPSQTVFGGGSGGGFAAFANTNAPTFGSLAGAPAASGSQMFGGGGGSIFGGAASNFGQSQTPPTTAAAPSFSQWRG